MKDSMPWKVKRRDNQEKIWKGFVWEIWGKVVVLNFTNYMCFFTFNSYSLWTASLWLDYITALCCSRPIISVAPCFSHLRFGLQWGVVIWVLLPDGHQYSPCVCHWQATWLVPSNRLTSYNAHFSLPDS